MNPVRANHRVLVIAPDPVLAALIGGLVEAAHLQAAFLREGESAAEALTRIRPMAAILVDAMASEAESDVFLMDARRRGILVWLFGSNTTIARRRDWATARDVPVFTLPEDLEDLRNVLERVLEPPKPSERTKDRRAAHTERAPDGTLVFYDAQGTPWTVYDRRSGDRRGRTIDRQFINPRGEVRSCQVSGDEAKSEATATIAAQLVRAVKIKPT